MRIAKKKCMRAASLIVCGALMLGIVGSAEESPRAATNQSIQDKERQVAQAQKEKEELEGSLSNLRNIKNSLESERKDLKSYVAGLDENLSTIEQNIRDLTANISVKEEEIAAAEEELKEAIGREENQKEFMVDRIRCVYENGNLQMVDLLVKSESIGDLLNKADYVEKVISYDQKMLREYMEMREYANLCMQELELEKEILETTKSNIEIEQKNLEELIEQKKRDITAYDTDINTKEKAIQEYLAEIKAQDEEIAALEALIAEEKRRLIESQGTALSYDGGMFKFPLATYTRISDDYGQRIHPTLGIPQFHNGVDFAAPKGTAIYAAYDGKVVAAAYSSSMGNYIMIDHGDELYTIYMHASALYVKKDAIVVKGETIAAVGSTGRSTGNHLHFSVRLNGEYTSPWNYLSK